MCDTFCILLGLVMLNASVLIKRKMVKLCSEHIPNSYVTHVLHTARISNIECVLCDDKEKDGKCGAMERPYTRFICDTRPTYC